MLLNGLNQILPILASTFKDDVVSINEGKFGGRNSFLSWWISGCCIMPHLRAPVWVCRTNRKFQQSVQDLYVYVSLCFMTTRNNEIVRFHGSQLLPEPPIEPIADLNCKTYFKHFKHCWLSMAFKPQGYAQTSTCISTSPKGAAAVGFFIPLRPNHGCVSTKCLSSLKPSETGKLVAIVLMLLVS